jgi:molybdenum cofactor cytidylyltransferase
MTSKGLSASHTTSASGQPITAIVLAAGMSRRMGTPKQLLRFGDRMLLELTLENVRNSAADPIVLVLGYAAEEIQQKIPTDRLKVIINPAYQEGMASSLRGGLAAVDQEAQGALIVLADQPCIRPATLNALIEHHRKHRPQIVIPTYRGFRGNPVLLDRSVFPEVMAITGDVGCRAIFGSHTENIEKLEVNDPGILLDIDTDSDLETVIARTSPDTLSKSSSPPDLESRPEAPGSPSRPDLVLVGRDTLALSLARLGKFLGFAVTVVDPLLRLSDLADADRVLHRLDFSLLPGNLDRYIVVASRGQFDEDAVEQALHTRSAYVGLVANKKRGQELTASLRRKSIPEDKLAQLRTSAGLALGAETPEEIAMSIMAEIVAVRRGHKLE